MAINQAIRSLRMALCMEQRELAEKIGVTKSSMSLYENSKRHPRLRVIRKMLELAKTVNLELTVEDFLK